MGAKKGTTKQLLMERIGDESNDRLLARARSFAPCETRLELKQRIFPEISRNRNLWNRASGTRGELRVQGEFRRSREEENADRERGEGERGADAAK